MRSLSARAPLASLLSTALVAAGVAVAAPAAADATGPEITVKDGMSTGGDGRFTEVSFKLHDPSKVDGLTLNGVDKDLTDSTWSDLNSVKPGTFGAVEGDNTLIVRDVLGNETTVEFVLDTTGPEVTVKDSSDGADGRYREASFKLHDPSNVAELTLNGTEKNLTDNVWSDLNSVKPGTFGAVEGDNTLIVRDALGNETTYEFVLDTTGPEISVKPGSQGADGHYREASFKLQDGSKVDKVEINGTEKNLSDNVWSDVNGIEPGTFGAVEGDNTIVAYDVLGNTTTVDFVLDTTGPEITVKDGMSTGGDGRFAEVSFKLHDPSKIDKVEINGKHKGLSDNVWSDVNFVAPGTFGAVEGDNTIVAYDVLGNTTTMDFVLDTTGPRVTTKDDTMGGDAHYRSVSFKLHDPSKVDGLTLNGVEKDLSDNVWSDLNGVKPGTFGAVEGENTLVVRDVLGNTTTVEFVLDTERPVVTIDAPSAGATMSAAEAGDVVVTAADGTQLRRVSANLYQDGSFYRAIGSTSAASAIGEATWSGGWAIPTDLPAGTYTVRVGARDLAGNWGGANVDIVIGASDAEGDGSGPEGDGGDSDADELSLDGSTLETASVDGVPWIVFDVQVTGPLAELTNDEVTLTLTDGTNTVRLELGTLVDGGLAGSILWPGTELDEDGAPTDFAGWAFTDGSWTQSEDDFAWTLGDITATLAVNPDLEVDSFTYPADAGPQVTDGVEELTPVADEDDSEQVDAAAGADVAATTSANAAGAELATTGSSALWLGLGALLLIAAGGSIVFLRRRA